MTVINQTLTLLTVRQGNGRAGTTDTVSKSVRASVSRPGINLAVRAEYVGHRIDLLAVIRRSDYSDSFNYAEYKGVRYRITSANATDKDLFVRLALSRG